MQIFTSILLGILTVFFTNASYAEKKIIPVENSVIKIYTTFVTPDYLSPWQLSNPLHASGSGTVISGNRVLTNAHVVADAKYLQVQKYNDPKKYIAEVRFISHYADLAILSVKDKSFFNDLNALEIGELPELQQDVTVYGYPFGGETLSITQGVLSRVEQQFYSHSNSYLLAGQIDAAINPGNSGGPVIVNNKIVGVVMQAIAAGVAANVGYFIPPSIIQHVLTDSKDNKRDGFPELGFRTQPLENPSAKLFYGLKKDQSGVLVVKVFEGGAAEGKLKKNDVILKIDQYEIAGNGTVNFNKTLRSYYEHAIELHHIGDKVEITFVRKGKLLKTVLIAQKNEARYSLVGQQKFDHIPKYYIYGGIVFVPLTRNMLNSWGMPQVNSGPYHFLNYKPEWRSVNKEESVVALQVLAADVNFGYHNVNSWLVDKINGKSIKNFVQFCQLLKANKEKNVIFENKQGYQIVLNHQEVKKSEKYILKLYRIPSIHSLGLFPKHKKSVAAK
ncbi:MAG: serine protease [Methylococcales bacterium]|nr:serine protease [Methylococcales bacterium]